MSQALEFRVWVELFLALASGVAVIVGLAAIIAGRLRIAAWQRTVWQVSTLGLAFLLICELTGIARGVTGWSREWLVRQSAENVGWDQRSAGPPQLSRNGGPALSLVPPYDSPALTNWPAVGWGCERLTSPPVACAPAGLVLVEHPTERGDESHHARNLVVPAVLRGVSHGSTETGPAVANSRDQSLDTSTNLDQITSLPAWLWLAGSVVLLGRLLVGWLLLESFRWRHRAIGHSSLHERVQSIARRLGMSRRVHVVVVPGLLGPIALGTLRPTVGLPESFTEQFDGGQQEAMLAHELGHLAAYDCAWHTLADLVAAALWWQPLVWWSRHELRSASEWAADEACLALPQGPEALATCLVALGRQIVRRHPAGGTGIEGNGFRSSLGRRVERLLHMSDRPRRRPQWISSSLVKIFGPAVMVTVALVSTGWSRPLEPTQGETMFQSIRQSWRQSLAALMFLGVAGNCDDSVTLALDDPFDQNAVAKNDTERDRPSVKDEDDDDRRDKESAQAKGDDDDDDDDRSDKKSAKERDDDEGDRGEEKADKEKDDDDDDKERAKKSVKENDYVAKSRDRLLERSAQLEERLAQLEAENAKLRDALQTKDPSAFAKKVSIGQREDKMPLKKVVKSKEAQPRKGGEKQADEQHQMLAKLKRIQDQVTQLQKDGRKEEAEKLSQAAQGLQQALAERQAKYGKEIKHGFQKPDPAAPHELGAVIKELAEQVHQLRAEVEELRRLVKDRGVDKE